MCVAHKPSWLLRKMSCLEYMYVIIRTKPGQNDINVYLGLINITIFIDNGLCSLFMSHTKY